MFVYVVTFSIAYEGDNVVGVFSDYVKARDFELAFIQKHNVGSDGEWTEIRKVEVDKVYDNLFQDGIGEGV